MRRKSQGTPSHSNILVSKYKERSNSRALKDRDQSKSNSKGRYKDVKCHYCHKNGHIKKYYWKLKNKSEKDSNDKVNMIIIMKTESMQLLLTSF